MTSLSTLLIVSGLLLFSQGQGAGAVLNFESLSDGETVTSQFPGATFSSTIALVAGISLNEFEFPPSSGSVVVSDDGGPITIVFSSPVLSVFGYFTYLTQTTLTAFDAGSNQLDQAVSLFGNNLALSGDPGSTPNELLTVASAAGISSITITGDPFGGSFTLDDLTFEAATTEVPEPRYTILILAGALAGRALRKLNVL